MTKSNKPTNICAAPEGVTHDIERITPEIARTWLTEHNTRNRPIRPIRVARYARDQATPGHWTFTGMPVSFDWDGVLLNGQHTLLGIEKSGAHVDLMIVRGLEPRAQLNTDTGGARTLADSLNLKGVPNAPYVASVARRVVRFDRGSIASGGSLETPTFEEMMDFLQVDDDNQVRNILAIRAAEVCKFASNQKMDGTPTTLGSLYYVSARLEGAQPQAEEFWVRQVVEGLGLDEGYPSRAYRNRLGGEPMTPDEQFRYGILAWNHFRAGNEITRMQMPRGGWKDKTLIPK